MCLIKMLVNEFLSPVLTQEFLITNIQNRVPTSKNNERDQLMLFKEITVVCSINHIFKQCIWEAWTGCIWLRIRTGGELF